VQAIDASGRFRACAVNGVRLASFEFRIEFDRADDEDLPGLVLRAVLSDGTRSEFARLVDHSMVTDPYHMLIGSFFAMCRARGSETPSRVIEIGSRARSGHVRREMVAPMAYVGLDILPGENTDLVGDAHVLSRLVPPESFDAAFSLSTFEHLAMPWKAVIELNRVLRPGALVLVASHQTFPIHDAPWDYWRFSTSAWHALFNRETGFHVLETAMGEPAKVIANMEHSVTRGLDEQPAFIASAVLAEKVGPTTLDWPVDPSILNATEYPQ
jgi:hypothetical protein